MVRMLRVAVPAAVVLAMAGIVAMSIFNPFRMLLPKLPVDMGNLVVSGTKITMESPHLSGFTPDQRPYEMWAKTAIQDLTDPDHVELKKLRAKVLMEDRSTVYLDARTGLFDNKAQMLDLRKDIFLQSSTGYEARLDAGLCRHRQGHGDVGRACRRQIAERHADRRQAADHQRRRDRRFEGNVVMNLDSLRCRRQPAAPCRARAARQDAVDLRPSPPTRNEFDDEVFRAQRSAGRIAHGIVRGCVAFA